METGKAIYKLLKDSTAVGAICADRIYPELAQQDIDTPFVVYTVTDTTPSGTKNATSKLDTARVELYCVSDDYEQGMNLGIAVRGALDRVSGDINGVQVQSIDFDTSDIQFDPDQRVYVLEQTYDVRIQRVGTAVAYATLPSNVITIEEVDGTPSGSANKLVFTNGTVTINGNTATIESGGGGVTVQEVDGAPSANATQLVVPNGTLSFDGATATLDFTLDTLDTTGILEQIAIQLATDNGVSSSEFPNGLIGDFDQDGYVGSADLLVFLSVFGSSLSGLELSNRISSAFSMADGDPFDVVRSLNNERPDRDGDLNITTSEIPEGTRLYFTDARADARIAAAQISDLSDTPAGIGTTGQVLAVNSGRTGFEFVNQPTIPDHSIYVQTVNTIAPDQEGEVTLDTTDVAEGTNLYYTDARFDTRYATKTHYHGRYDSTASTERSGATANVEVYYTARPDGDGYAESATSDVGETDTINRTLFYSTKFQADPDTAGDWTQYTTQPADNATFATAKAALLAGLNDTDATAETRGTLPLSLKMVRTTTAVTNLLLDTYTGAAAAYSVRKLDKDYTGSCMRVREDSGDTETDIGFDGSGNLDTSAIATHCGSANGYVVTWYDQSGNSNNATQSTVGRQPQIYNGTAVITENGKAAIDNDGLSGNHFVLSTALGNVSTYSVFSVLENGVRNIVSGEGSMLFAKGAADWIWYSNASTINVNATGSSKNISTSWSTAQRLDYHALASGTASFGTNASTLDTVGSVSGGMPMDFILGHYATAGNYNYHGKVQELIIYTSDQSSNRTGIESDINTYFSIYT